MKFCPVVPEICRGQVHGPRKDRRKRIRIRIIKIKIIIRNRAKTCLGDLINIYVYSIIPSFNNQFSWKLYDELGKTVWKLVKMCEISATDKFKDFDLVLFQWSITIKKISWLWPKKRIFNLSETHLNSFPHSWPTTRFLTIVTQWLLLVPVVEQEQHDLPKHPQFFGGVLVAQSIVFCVVICR